MQKPLSDMAKYIRSIIPSNIPELYSLKPRIKDIADEESVKYSVVAFRDFLYLVCDRLIADGSLYEKTSKNVKNNTHQHTSLPVCYPFINNIKNILFNIGYHGKLDENGSLILLDNWQQLTFTLGLNGIHQSTKITVPKVIESLRFLTDCGVYVTGINLDEAKPNFSEAEPLTISFPDNSAMLTGLKVMAIAQRDLDIKGYDDVFLRCDYRVLKEEDIDIAASLKELFRPLPAKVQDFAFKLHKRYTDVGLMCRVDVVFLVIRFTYFYKNKEVWSFSISVDSGYRVIIKSQNTHLFTDVVGRLHPSLQNIIARGYGCNKKMFGEPCQKGCHGFSITLDDELLDIGEDIVVWIDSEIACL